MTPAQLSLFGAGQGADPTALALAPPPSDTAELAARLPAALRLGAMSWTYPGWIGSFYAPTVKARRLAERGLTAYARHPLLRCVEIDRSYYDPLSSETYAAFAAQVPDGFRFAAKAHEACTAVSFPRHARYGARAGQRNPRLLDAGYAAEQVVGPFVAGLGAKAGPLVFQFSSFSVRSPQRFAEHLHRFLGRLPRGPLYAVELRNPELVTSAYGEALRDVGAVHCHNAWGAMPDVLAQRSALPGASRRPLVARWLHRPGQSHESARQRYLPFSRIAEEDLPRREQIATLVAEAIAGGAEAHVLVSNKAEGHAPETVRRLARAIVDATSEAVAR